MRSRLVGQEFATDVRYDTFASTPPLKAVKLVLILASTDLSGNKAEQKLHERHRGANPQASGRVKHLEVVDKTPAFRKIGTADNLDVGILWLLVWSHVWSHVQTTTAYETRRIVQKHMRGTYIDQ